MDTTPNGMILEMKNAVLRLQGNVSIMDPGDTNYEEAGGNPH